MINKIKQINRKRFIFISFSIIIFLFGIWYLQFFQIHINLFSKSFEIIRNLFAFKWDYLNNPNDNLWIWNLKKLFETIEIIFSATAFSFFIALITAFFSVPRIFQHKILIYTTRILILILRSFPILIFLTMFQKILGSQKIIAFSVYFWFTWLWLHRYFVEIIENSSFKKFYLSVLLGESKLIAFYKYLFLPNKNKLLMNFLLGIESNVRWSAILGIVGIFGIGDFFHTFTKIEDMKYLGITILYIMLLVFFIEAILYTFNNFLFRENKYNLPQKSKWSIYRHKQIIKIVLFLFSLFYSLYGFMHILFDSSYIFNQNGFSEFFGTFFKLDFSEITNDPKVYLIYIKIAFQVYIVLFIGFFSAAFYSFFCADKLHNISIVFLFKLLLSFIKAIPIIIFFIIFNPILSTYAALTLSLAVSTFRSLAKQFNEHFNAISSKEINLLRDLGWSKWKIYIDFIFKKALKFVLGNASFEIEGTYRNAMNYSMFIPSGIGIYELISRYSKYNQYGKIVPLLLPAIILFISLELSYLFIKTKKFQKDNLRWTN